MHAAHGRCTDRSAYVSLLTRHPTTTTQWKTFINKKLEEGTGITRQVTLLVVLVRSLRRVENCLRDFVLLLGDSVQLSAHHRALLGSAGVILHSIPPLVLGVPTIDKLHAWRLTNYTRLAVIDADLLAVRSLDDLFANRGFSVAHHPYDRGCREVCAAWLLSSAWSALSSLWSQA